MATYSRGKPHLVQLQIAPPVWAWQVGGMCYVTRHDVTEPEVNREIHPREMIVQDRIRLIAHLATENHSAFAEWFFVFANLIARGVRGRVHYTVRWS